MSNQETDINKQINTGKAKFDKQIDVRKLEQEIKEVKREVIKEKQNEAIVERTNEQEKAEQLKQNQQGEAKAKAGAPGRTAIIFILSSKNNTLVTLTDITGSEILAKLTGGILIKKKSHRDEQAAAIGIVQGIENILAQHKILRLIVKVRGRGGIKSDRIGQAAQIILKMLSRDKYEIIHLKDVTPIYYGKKLKYGRRGRKV
ncbi:MAG: 30S ribosomal protein S11 [Euryarchaeota archaeon HGW-Euryarchaeota-1]|nr:MAG: 30S ribosomal protein S11 [Euryarchaeota archaeon HGW-Euryarchaeota-1]